MTESANLPSFNQAPVVETVLCAQFDPIRNFRTAHLGAFWKCLGDEWPETSDVPAIEPQFERFGELNNPGFQGLQFQLRLQQSMGIRLQIRNRVGDRMIQLQNGRLIYNWQGHDGGPYPRYPTVRREFDGILEQLKTFLDAESLGTFCPNQWEVTYVNQFPRETVWNRPDDWDRLFRNPIIAPSGFDLVRLESFGGEWHFEIPPQKGRLHIRIAHGRSGASAKEVLTVTLTARGPLKFEDGTSVSLDEGLDCGRAIIVKTFAQITSDEAHRFWERVYDSNS